MDDTTLDAIEARQKAAASARWEIIGGRDGPRALMALLGEDVPALVAEVRGLTEENASYADELLTCDREEWHARALSAEAEVGRLIASLDMSERLLATMDHWAEVAETCERKANESHARREAAEAEVGTLRAKLAAVEDLHWEVEGKCAHCRDCYHDDYLAWPCPTVAALATTGEGQ